MTVLESVVHKILDDAIDHPDSCPQGIVIQLRRALGEPEAQETREPEE